MSTYTVLYAMDVPHYASIEIEADDAAQALIVANARWTNYRAGAETFALQDPDWEHGVHARIVHIECDDGPKAGETVHQDVSLDGFRLCRVGVHDTTVLALAGGALLNEVSNILLEADHCATVAREDLLYDQFLAAVGAVVGVEERLADATALLRAISVLNRAIHSRKRGAR